MKAYITVCTNITYIGGVTALYSSLMDTNPQYPFYCVIPAHSDNRMIKSLEIKGINYLTCESISYVGENKVDYWNETLFKLNIFDLTQFSKICYLDSDMIVLHNLDHLFSYPSLAAVPAGKELHNDWDDLNSGIMIIEPNHNTFQNLLEIIDCVAEQKANVGFGDQDVIKSYFSDWRNRKECHIPLNYNVMLGYAGIQYKHGIIKNHNDVMVYHFTGKEKPWYNLKCRLVILLKAVIRSKSLFDIYYLKIYQSVLRKTKS